MPAERDVPSWSMMRCDGCGWLAPTDAPLPFRCERDANDDDRKGSDDSHDDIDHVMTRWMLFNREADRAPFEHDEPNPFVRFRRLQHSYRLARRQGMTDAAYCELVRELDRQVADARPVRGAGGFVCTPYRRVAELGVWVKDETGGVGNAHKGRHLMATAIHLRVVEALGLVDTSGRELAIASCGTAATSAAIIARALGHPLRVFVPDTTDPEVISRLERLGARLELCRRESDAVAGDPCYHGFLWAVRGGALPFSCQGRDNALAIEGGRLLGYELAAAHHREQITLERLFVQVGGGALMSSICAGLQDAVALEIIPALPQLYAVQSEAVYPLVRAWRRLTRLAEERDDAGGVGKQPSLSEHASRHRSQYMARWERPGTSIASGILDDETYDWLGIVRGLENSDGAALTVPEALIAQARDRGREATGIEVSATGAVGLAGAMAMPAPTGNRGATAVVFTGGPLT